jgi:peptide/nickel transport system permease protein
VARSAHEAEVTAAADVEATAPPGRRSLPGGRVLRRLARQPATVGALAFLVPLLVVAGWAPDFAPYHWVHFDIDWRQHGPTLARWHLFGTDDIGRDIFSRTLWGLGATEQVAFEVAGAATAIGVLVGALAGYLGGWVDAFLMRLGDLVTAYPAFVVLLGAIVYFHPISTRILGIVLTGYLWVYVARVVRASFVAQRGQEYVEAARALGASDLRIAVRHLLPNSAGPVVVSATSLVGQAVVLEATAEFFNFGLNQNTRPTLGNLIADVTKYGVGQQNTVGLHWWTWAFPALVLVLVVTAINLIGDGLDAALDPRSSRVT